MNFRISALPAAAFQPLYGLPTEALAVRGVLRRIASAKPGFPCRVSLVDAEPGEAVLLLNHVHQSAGSPYRASHAIYVRDGAIEAQPQVNEVPALFRHRLLSLRAFDAAGMMVEADVVEGSALEPLIERMLANPLSACLHLHNAKPGCYAARVDRA